MATHYIPKIVYNAITINFDYPTKGADVYGEGYTRSATVKTSKSGIQQTVFNYVEVDYNVTFSFLTTAQVASLKTFLEDWAFLGKEFTYQFDEGDGATAETVKLAASSRKVKFKIQTWKAGSALYEVKLKFRRKL